MDGWMDGNEKHAFPMSTHLVTFVYYYYFLLLVVAPQPAPEFYGVPKKPLFFFLSCVYPEHCDSFSLPRSFLIIIYLSPLIVLIPPFRFHGITIFDIPVEQENHWTIIFFGLTIYHIRHHAPPEEEICLVSFFRFKANILIVIIVIIIVTPSS